ncbi:hypothetical protein HMPREF0105_4454 [Bacteroides sp. 3_1_33FAA]|uniref:Uncharacterized protein n=1 Tax=Phocaeicola dorei DSM 17855 TaxID=483217 RepID=B6VSJ6_9BACT|nr:hypothetical protein BACDOR_00245 [Phocaeicola dorei DSM 17855]EEZ19205.1 hypothetical protein HMPREF0105_4454 [Bacteroides sp. 3_1_33FAA]
MLELQITEGFLFSCCSIDLRFGSKDKKKRSDSCLSSGKNLKFIFLDINQTVAS